MRIFPLDVFNTLNNAEILPASIFLNGKKTASIHVAGMNIHNKVFESFELGFSIIVVAQELSDKLGFGLFERNVVWVAAKDILEFAFKLVDIIVGLASELKFNFFVSSLSPLLLFCSFIEIFAQVIDDSVVVMTVFFPKLAQLFLISLGYLHNCISDLQALLQKRFEVSFVIVILVNCEISFGFVEPDIW